MNCGQNYRAIKLKFSISYGDYRLSFLRMIVVILDHKILVS